MSSNVSVSLASFTNVMHYIGAAILNRVIPKDVDIANIMSDNSVALFPLGSAA